ncbi:uncharacterized protein LOC143286461 isoform X2 [Babylonia areolata]|uniref:uncharacterized protein LOC143286461 isoform X2 n=1 Tax=Babylonia areolata TaxID=304850 RepID=UPI003FD66480
MLCYNIANHLATHLFIFLLGMAAVQGDIVSYNASSRELTLRCPRDWVRNGKVLYAGLLRQSDDLLLANWTYDDGGPSPPPSMAIYDRARLRQAREPHVLAVVLSYVTCYDVTTYVCDMIVSWNNGRHGKVVERQAFTLEGDVTEPVLKVEPKQARYQVEDTIHLTCSASIGTHNNSILWETRLPGDHFSPVNGICDQQTNIPEHTPAADSKAKACGVTSVSSLTHILTPDDDNREWRCRLRNTNHTAVFVAAVQCTDGAGCAKTLKKESPQVMLTLIVVICVLFVTMVISIVVLTGMLRRQTKKQLAPLIISPPPSDGAYPYICSAARTRSLPHLPSVDHYASPETSDLGVHGLDDTKRHHVLSDASSSVYVSMSAIPSLQEGRGWGQGRQRNESNITDHSESIYSNQEACNTEVTKVLSSSTSVGSHESHVTMGNLKGWM